MTRHQVTYVELSRWNLHDLLDDLGTYWTQRFTAVNAQVVVEDMIQRYHGKGRAEVKHVGIRVWQRGVRLRRGYAKRSA